MSQWDRCSMRVDPLDVMGSDNTVVDAARVSFAKEANNYSAEQNAQLIRYLAHHNHWLPFRHPHLSFRCSAPIFVARQLGKHQVGLSWSEISRRYVDSDPEFYTPEYWRAKSPDKKQGSMDTPVTTLSPTKLKILEIDPEYKALLDHAYTLYIEMLGAGVAPEQARMVLPQSMYTEWVWTGSLLSFVHMLSMRLAPDTQKETRDFVSLFIPYIEENFPVSYPALMNSYRP